MEIPSFTQMPYKRPELSQVIARYGELLRELEQSKSDFRLAEATVKAWDQLKSSLSTAGHLISVRYHQNTLDPVLHEEKKFLDDLEPTLKEWDMKLAQALLNHPLRDALEQAFGKQLFVLLQTQLHTFRPEIADLLRQESDLSRAYTDLLAQAKVEFDGQTLNLSALRRYASVQDRDVRLAAQRAKADYFVQQADRLDEIYHLLVDTRQQMAQTLGYRNFIPLGYALMGRTDYTPKDVLQLREEIHREVVPLATDLREAQRKRLGLDRLYFYDESVMDPEGNPKPKGDTAWIVDRAADMFRTMGDETDHFFTLMREYHLLDLDTRAGKAGGGFCTEFSDYRVPFIFANFNGTGEDVWTLTHECGHAFQSYMSREAILVEYLFPTLEACEIHSMSMELLTAPYMPLFFGEDAERFSTNHLRDAILFLPYAAAVDEFQHYVYENPKISPLERKRFWQNMERKYLPSRAYAGLPHMRDGGIWQGQSHIYSSPFYYIDYAIAQICALQLWKRHSEDPARAFRDYLALCRPGGRLPFLQLIKEGNLISPFEGGCLREIVAQVKSKIL